MNLGIHGMVGWILASRPRVVVVLLGVLALLDVARSWNAHVGYAQPVERWRPDPRVYADLAWPPDIDAPAGAPLGVRVYAQRCAVCHGPDGRGNGPAAPSLIPRPRDFTLGQYTYKSTPAGQPPTDADLISVVADGLRASSMPSWRDLLSDEEIRAVVGHIKSLSTAFAGPPIAAPATAARQERDAAGIARGRTAYEARGCAACHGHDGRGGLALQDAKSYPVIARDLTAPWTFRGGSDPAQVAMRITAGMAPGPMPPLPPDATPQEQADLVSYVRSLARTPPWEPGGRLDGPGFSGDLTRRGEYLVHAQVCGLCHTMIDASGIYRADDRYLAGGMRVVAYPHGVMVTRNLTSDPDTGLGRWSDAQIVAALRDGRSGGRVLAVFGMPWAFFHAMTDDDATAVARYLKTLPPVHNRIPPPLYYGFVETVVAKLMRPLPQVPTTFLTYADQGFGYSDGEPGRWPSPAALQQALVTTQWLVLALGVIAFVLAGPRERRFPASIRGRIAVAAGVAMLALAGAAGAMIYDLPQLAVIPPQQIAAGATAGIFKPDRAALGSDEHAAMVERGRYLFTIVSCALCHGNDGSGGLKVSWKPFGTLWARNLSSDRETGLGAWTDDQIARAMRSGVSRDGHMLHWQGMTWDHISNWDEEDIRALIAYLRVLPPVRKKVPGDRPPAPDDCDVYTFWTTVSEGPGCGP